MTQRREATGQRATDLAGADDANLHCSRPFNNHAGICCGDGRALHRQLS